MGIIIVSVSVQDSEHKGLKPCGARFWTSAQEDISGSYDSYLEASWADMTSESRSSQYQNPW